MAHDNFKKLVFLYCECIMEKDNPDFISLSATDLHFCEQYTKAIDEDINFDGNTSLARELVQRYSIEYCRRKLENGKSPFAFFEERSIKIHVEEIDKQCIAEDQNKSLSSLFKHTIINLISLEYYSFQNMSVQISNQIDNYHSLKDKKDEEKHCKQVEELSSLKASIQSSIESANEEYSKIEHNIDEFQKKTYETNITILGIFASIVLVFNASVSFYSAAIEAFSELDISKIIFIFSLIGVIIIAAIMGLLSYLETVRNKQEIIDNKISSVKKPLKHVIIFLIVVMALIFVSGCLKNNITQTTSGPSVTEPTSSHNWVTAPNIPDVGV